LTTNAGPARSRGTRQAVHFRMPVTEYYSGEWPVAYVNPDPGKSTVLDGADVINDERYTFRRWSHLRFVGPLEVSDVNLSKPAALDAR